MSYDATHAPSAHHDEHEHHQQETTIFGFWVYLMTDCIIFGSLFAVFAVLCHHFAGGPTGRDFIKIPNVEIETAILLLSSITFGFAFLSAKRGGKGGTLAWLLVTFLLGLSFVGLEISEFAEMVDHGMGPDKSAFLSSFFTLVGTHGLHVTIGLVWMFILFFQMMGKQGLGSRMMTKLTCLSLFWHFLDVVWICVFSFVYLGSYIS